MPTNESWLDESTLLVKMTGPIDADDLAFCFERVSREIAVSATTVDLVVDILDAGHIPVEASRLAIRAGFLTDSKLRRVAVVGISKWAQLLGAIATRGTRKKIDFFYTVEEAFIDLQPEIAAR